MALTALIRRPVKPSCLQRLFYLSETSSVAFTYKTKYFWKPSVRNFYKDYLGVSPKTSARLKDSDGVPKTYNLIYQTPLGNYLKLGYPTILLCATVFPAYCLYSYLNGTQLSKSSPVNYGRKIVFINPNVEVVIYLGAFCLFNAGILAVLFKSPFRIYKHSKEQKYLAIFLSPVPTKVQQIHFTTANQTRFKNPLYFFFQGCHHLFDKKKALLFSYCFRTPGDYCDMVGID